LNQEINGKYIDCLKSNEFSFIDWINTKQLFYETNNIYKKEIFKVIILMLK
jgi:hypothetical protein